MIKKQYIQEGFSNKYLETLISNVIIENSQDNQDFLTIELAKSSLYTLINVIDEENNKVDLLSVSEDGNTLLPVFTNEDEMRFAKEQGKFEVVLIDFSELIELIVYEDNGYGGFIINPESSKVIIDKELIEHIIDRNRLEDGTVNITKADTISIEEMEKKEYPKNIIDALNTHFKSQKNINAAYFTTLNQNGHRSYLLITDFTGNKDDIFKKISSVVKPHLKGVFLDQLEYNTEFGKQVTKDLKPFYKKKVFGIF